MYRKGQELQPYVEGAPNEHRVPMLSMSATNGLPDNSAHMGSIEQLRFGKMVGDSLGGLDPVFGALLSPTGGIPGAGNDRVTNAFGLGAVGGLDVVTNHGIAHDAAGYLLNYHQRGPGYIYVPGVSDALSKTDPLAGQTTGLSFYSNLKLYGTPTAPTRGGEIGLNRTQQFDDGYSPAAKAEIQRNLAMEAGGDIVNVAYRMPSASDSTSARAIAMLKELGDPSTLNSPSRLKAIYGAVYDFNQSQISGMTPEATALKIAQTYQDIYNDDPTAVWHGLATYAVGKVGEGYQLFKTASAVDPADASIARQGFFEGNKAIYNSMMTAEMVYQAGGAAAVRAMQDAGVPFGADPSGQGQKFKFSLSESFDLRDQAKAAFAFGHTEAANALLSQSLKASADFEQRVVIQQYYDKSYPGTDYAGSTSNKTLGNALNSMGPDVLYQVGAVKGMAQSFASYASTVTVLGESVRFTEKNVANVDERMPFVYDTARAFLSGASTGMVNGLTAQQRIYQDQSQMMQRVWPAAMVPGTGRR